MFCNIAKMHVVGTLKEPVKRCGECGLRHRLGDVQMIKYSLEKKVDCVRLVDLFKQVDWSNKTSDLERLKLMIENSQIVVTAWDHEKMVGFARCITDYVFNAQINNVVVDQEYRGRGIGKELISRILQSSNKVTYILRGDPENIGFYKQIGFKDTDLSLVFNRFE